ncbi:MAG: fumarylacetoacetate hydrolase family protein, partial [Candidatus Poseidoniales archaeon]|nr:fumarylacetoacetate hydrolase family protein [Candidatus Poseidoniales archaeon]
IEGYIAGLTVGQDLSERDLQLAGNNPQFSLSKSHRGFAQIGPEVVTLDEFESPWDLEIRCDRNDVNVQQARTSQLIHGIPSLLVYLSSICELRAGDLVFTGTPSGVGFGRTPPEYLEPGDVLNSTIQGIGTIRNRCL